MLTETHPFTSPSDSPIPVLASTRLEVRHRDGLLWAADCQYGQALAGDMPPRPLPPSPKPPMRYEGPITPESAAEGIRLAYSNALGLLSDAKLLFEHGRFARSAALSVLALEEFGKVSEIVGIVELDPTETTLLRQAWRLGFRSHQSKNSALSETQFLISVSRQEGRAAAEKLTMEEMGGALVKNEHTAWLERTKQLMLYVECLGKTPVWSSPSSRFNQKRAEAFLTLARSVAVAAKESMQEHTPEMIATLAKHTRPVDKADFPALVAALKEAYKEGAARGYVSNEYVADMLQFLSPSNK